MTSTVETVCKLFHLLALLRLLPISIASEVDYVRDGRPRKPFYLVLVEDLKWVQLALKRHGSRHVPSIDTKVVGPQHIH